MKAGGAFDSMSTKVFKALGRKNKISTLIDAATAEYMGRQEIRSAVQEMCYES